MVVRKLLLGVVVAAVVTGGGMVADIAAAPEAHAACYGSVSMWKGKNNSCSTARHWDSIKNAPSRYGAWVGKARWSQQSACWANVTSDGMTAK